MKKTSLTLAALVALSGVAQAGLPGWRPQASEKLVRMQPNYIVKALDRDFLTSELGGALADVNGRIRAKAATISDLVAAVGRADEDVVTDLRQQLLSERRAYLDLVQEQQDLRRRQAKTKIRIYEDMLNKLERSGHGADAHATDLARAQEAVRARFADVAPEVSPALMGGEKKPESRYAAEYAKNVAAISHLVSAIGQHPMQAGATLDGQSVSKDVFLRQQVAAAEADLALIDQEDQIVGYMARLVALDAMALVEDVAEANMPEDISEMDGVADAVSLFVPE